jgi:hypothetical protein
MGVIVKRADSADEVIDAVEGAMKLAYNGYRATAVLLGQKLLGAKDFRKLAQVE